jgi:hypothetical protein
LEGEEEGTRFLPPEPPGPEPDLAGPPPQKPPAAAQQPPPPQQTYGYPPPATDAAPAPPAYPPPPPGYPQQPPPGYGPYQAPPPGWGPAPWAWQPPAPDNGQAVVGFVFSVVGIGLLLISFGVSSIVSVGCSVTGVVCSRNGKRKVERGETPKHKGLAQAGFIVGWVGLALAILATAAWIVALALGAFDESSTGGSGTPAHLRSAVAMTVWG